jgi:signal transduction histidine kinase
MFIVVEMFAWRITNERLIILDRAKPDFLHVISHAFCAPLNGLIGIGELILEGNSSSKEDSELQACLNDLVEESYPHWTILCS